MYNLDERVGGDPDLTPKGYEFCKMLESFFKDELSEESISDIKIFTSTLKRAIITAGHIGLELPVI
jgi:6-phosphofructo-2-kinase/fructose-2,6-biphosphatase 2